MRKLTHLKMDAALACKRRGHSMSRFISLSDKRAVSTCLNCKMEVHVDTHPMPNGIDIGGEAVALNCRKELK